MRTPRAPVLVLALALAPTPGCGDDPPAAEAAAPAAETAPAPEPEPAPEEATAEPEEPAPPPEVERPYDEEADAAADIEAALARAREGNKRVLLVFGANWCVWCRRLEHVLTNDPGVTSVLEEGFEVVHVNTGERRSGTNAEVNERYGDPISNGLPVLVVLDAEGAQVTTQETGSLEEGDRHDPAKIVAFLRSVRAS